MKKFAQEITPPLLLIIFLILTRIIPHIPNIAPVGAMSLFVGRNLKWQFAVIIPLITMYISDYFLGFHTTMIFVYGSFLAIAALGIYIKRFTNPFFILGAPVASSLLFFIVTNFGVFIAGDIYTRSWSGLVTCYLAALPFFRNTLIGDLIYTVVLFGGYELIKHSLHKMSLKFG